MAEDPKMAELFSKFFGPITTEQGLEFGGGLRDFSGQGKEGIIPNPDILLPPIKPKQNTFDLEIKSLMKGGFSFKDALSLTKSGSDRYSKLLKLRNPTKSYREFDQRFDMDIAMKPGLDAVFRKRTMDQLFGQLFLSNSLMAKEYLKPENLAEKGIKTMRDLGDALASDLSSLMQIDLSVRGRAL